MAYSKTFLSFLIVFSSFFHLCLCDDSLIQYLPDVGQRAAMKGADCMQIMLPCQPFLRTNLNPSPACCAPFNDMAKANDTSCFCNLINHPNMFLTFDVSKDAILKLPNSCGVNLDASCNAGGNGAAAGGNGSSSSKMITPYGITYFGVPGFIAFLSAMVFSAY